MTKPFVKNASIELGNFFIIGGQIAYVAEMDEGTKTKDGRETRDCESFMTTVPRATCCCARFAFALS